MLCLLLVIAGVSAHLVTIQLIGDDKVGLVHQSGKPVYLLEKSGYLRVCVAATWSNPCINTFDHNVRCAAITENCQCYQWMSTLSDTQCVLLPFTPATTTIGAKWNLMRRHNIVAATPRLSHWFDIVHSQSPKTRIGQFLTHICPVQITTTMPPPCTITHEIPLVRVHLSARIQSTESFQHASWAIAIAILFIPFGVTYIRFDI